MFFSKKFKTEMPRVIYIEKNNEDAVSDAKKVDNILKEIDSLKGELLSNTTRFKFERCLEQLLGYVTLIGYEITSGYYNLDNHRMEEILVYYFNEDLVRILGLQLMVDNPFQHAKDVTEYMWELREYKISCLQDRRCVVYNIDDTYEDRVFKLNLRMSNLGQVMK